MKKYFTTFFILAIILMPFFICAQTTTDDELSVFEEQSSGDFFSQISPSKKRPLKKATGFNEDRLKFATRIGNKRGAAVAASNLGAV